MDHRQQRVPLHCDGPSTRAPVIRLGTVEDVPGVRSLESRYFIGNLPPEQRENGFISILQPDGWFARIATDGGLHVATDEHETVVGFIVVAPPLHAWQASPPPIVARMIALADTLEYRGRRISSYKYALRGPVCIDERFRGRGLYDAFNVATKAAYSDAYDIGMLFVSARNPRSLRTTASKLNATTLDTFNVGDESYHYLVYELGCASTPSRRHRRDPV